MQIRKPLEPAPGRPRAPASRPLPLAPPLRGRPRPGRRPPIGLRRFGALGLAVGPLRHALLRELGPLGQVDEGEELPALHPGLLNDGDGDEVAQHLQGILEGLHTHLGVAHVPPQEAHHQPYGVPIGQEAPRPLHLEVAVVLVDAGRELDVLHLGRRAAGGAGPLGFTGLALHGVLEAPVVHDLADGRLRLRGHLDQVELLLLGHPHRLHGGHHAQVLLLARLVLHDQPHFRDPDALVDAVGFLHRRHHPGPTATPHQGGRGRQTGERRRAPGACGARTCTGRACRAGRIRTPRPRAGSRPGRNAPRARRAGRETWTAGTAGARPRPVAPGPGPSRGPSRGKSLALCLACRPALRAALGACAETLLREELLLARGKDEGLPTIGANNGAVLVGQCSISSVAGQSREPRWRGPLGLPDAGSHP